MPAAGCFGLSEAVRQILHENYTGLLSVFEEMGTIKAEEYPEWTDGGFCMRRAPERKREFL